MQQTGAGLAGLPPPTEGADGLSHAYWRARQVPTAADRRVFTGIYRGAVAQAELGGAQRSTFKGRGEHLDVFGWGHVLGMVDPHGSPRLQGGNAGVVTLTLRPGVVSSDNPGIFVHVPEAAARHPLVRASSS